MNMIKRGLLLLLAAAVLAGAGCSAKAKKAYHLKRAEKYYAAGQYDRAEIEYLNVLGRDPQNARAFGQLGQIYYAEGRLQRAVFFLTKGSQMATNDLDLRLKFGLVCTASGQFPQAREAADFVLQRQPTNDEALLLLVESTIQPKEIAGTRQRLQTLARAGDRAAIEVALGNLAFREHDLTNAGAAFQRAQALDPKSTLVQGALAAWSWAQGDLKSAAAFFKSAAEAAPPRSPHRMQYARFKIQTGDPAGARQVLNEVLTQAPGYVPAQMVLAEIAATEKNFDEAAKLVAQVLTEDPDGFDPLLFSARLQLAQAQPGAAALELERLLRLYPQATRAQLLLAQACLANNDVAKAVGTLNQAITLEPDFADAILLLAQINIRNGNATPAIASLEPLARKYPQLVQAQLLLADAYRLQNRTRDALAIYEPLQKAQPQNPQLPLLAGSAYQQLGDSAHARQAFNRALALAPDNRPALEQLLNLDLAETNYAGALQRVNAELAKAPKESVLYLLQAKIFMEEKHPEQTEAALLKAIELDPQNESSYLLLAKMYFDTQQTPKALVQLEAALAKNTNDLSALMLEAVIYNASQKYQLAADTYEKVLAIEPRSREAINNLAYLYSTRLINHLDRAYELAQQAHDLDPYNPATADTLGWVCYQRAAYPTAMALLKESAAKLPGEPEVQFHFGMASYMQCDEDSAQKAFALARQSTADFMGRDEMARCQAILAINPQTAGDAERTLLEKRVAEKADDPIALARLSTIYQRAGKLDQTIAVNEKILQTNPNQLQALINLASLYPDARKAYDAARSAYKLAPGNPVVARVFGHQAFQAGDFKLALSVLQPAAQSSPADAALQFELAQAQFSVGNPAQAQVSLRNSLARGLPPASAPAASRMLEMLELAANPTQAVAAKAQIDTSLKADPNYYPALLAQATAAEQQADLPTAQAAYEKILNHYPEFSLAQKQLATIYTGDPGKLDQAYGLAIKVREIFPNDPALTRTLGILLAQKGDYTRALTPLKTSAAGIGRNDPIVFFYLGTAQFQLKNNAESKASLQQALALKLSGKQAEAARQMLSNLK